MTKRQEEDVSGDVAVVNSCRFPSEAILCKDCLKWRRRYEESLEDYNRLAVICDRESTTRKKMYIICFLAWCLLYVVGKAYAADIGCGRDTDRNGSVDNWCPGDDKDFDGYTEAQGDCDDEDWNIQPGRVTTKGCSAGSYRTCKASGAGYTACIASSTTPYCPQGDHTTHVGLSATACKYIDASSGSDTTGDGSWANPWASPKKVSRYDSGAYFPVAGDAIIVKSGTYTETATADTANSVVMFVAFNDGTESNPIWILGYPGTKPVFQGSLSLYEADHYIVRDFEITQGTQQSGGFNANGTPEYIDVAGLYVHDKQGVRANNHHCIAMSQTSTGTTMHHNYVANCYDPNQEGADGNGLYVSNAGVGTNISYNIVMQGTEGGTCIYEKHLPASGTSGTVYGNYCQTSLSGWQSSGGKNRTVSRNLFVGCNIAAELSSSAGNTYWGNTIYEYNTSTCKVMFYAKPTWGYDLTGARPASEECSCTWGTDCGDDDQTPNTWETSHVRYNINLSAATGNYDHILMGTYESNITKQLIDGKFLFTYNGFSNSNGLTPRLSYFAENGSCNTYCCGWGTEGAWYTGLTAMQAFGFEDGSIHANPDLASGTYITTNEDMADWGYMQSDGITTTTTVTTTTTIPVTTTTTAPSTTTTTIPVVYGSGARHTRGILWY